MKTQTMVVLQKICNEFTNTTQYTPLMYATMGSAVSCPTAEVVSAMRRVCMIMREAERIMPPSSFNMMKKALFTVWL